MPWKDVKTMDERTRFIARLLDGERMVDLCREFGISRKTGYKFWDRYQSDGALGLMNLPCSPNRIPHRTPDAVERLVLKLRQHCPTWGAKKIKARLEELHPGVQIPASSTVGEILKRHGLLEKRRRLREKNLFAHHPIEGLTPGDSPNDVWCIDFKGQFRLGNGKYCYPLTITDYYSRYLIACEALENVRTVNALPVFESAFREYGLPRIIRSDNGSPFASRGLAHLSMLSAQFIRLGIRPERIEPGHPEQNGRHERMHLTLQKETTRPAASGFLAQQEVFDRFIRRFNHERPHEALNMKTPASVYQPSDRKFPDPVPEPNYPTFDVVRTVMTQGCIRIPGGDYRCFLTHALIGQSVGIRELNKDVWLVNFSGLDLGYAVREGNSWQLSPDNPLATSED